MSSATTAMRNLMGRKAANLYLKEVPRVAGEQAYLNRIAAASAILMRIAQRIETGSHAFSDLHPDNPASSGATENQNDALTMSNDRTD